LSVSDESDTILLYLDNEAARIRIYRSKHPIQLDLRQKNDHSAIYGYSAGAGQPTALLKQAVLNYLNQRRLLTTRIHVVNPSYQQIKLEVSVVLRPNTHGNETLHQALQGIYRYFDPVRGGPEGTGWPLGRGLYRSEVCALVERIPGIDHISKIVMNDNEEAAMVKIAEHQLIQINPVVIEEKVYHE
ncbi:MAG TPA: hypothetical protein VEC37_09400, partial [Bacillota bacterium]|nr:hypothetical protein [Bacillota bacterium]